MRMRYMLAALLGLAVVFPAMARLAEYRNPEMVAAVEAGEIDEANVLWWGFDEEDSAAYLQAAINSGVARLIVPNVGQDWIVRPIFLRGDQEIVFEDGVVVTAKKGEFHHVRDSLLTAQDVENLVLRGYGATFKMHKDDYADPTKYEKGEWRMGLAIRGARNVEIYGLTIRDTGGDGIILASGNRFTASENVVIRDVTTDNCYRQGISVISARNVLIENCVFKNTGGTPPGAGIDLEPDRAHQPLANIIIRNSLFENNVLGMHMWLHKLDASSDDVSILWENNIVRGGNVGVNVRWGSQNNPKGTIIFRGCIVEDTQQVGIRLGSVPSKELEVLLEECILRNTALDADHVILNRKTAPMVFTAHADSRKDGRGRVTFKDVVFGDSYDRPLLIGIGQNVRTAGDTPDVVGRIDVSSPYDVSYRWEAAAKQIALDLQPIADPGPMYDKILARFEQAKDAAAKRAFVWPDFQFDALEHDAVVLGALETGVRLINVDEEALEGVEILLDGESIYRGARLPESGRVVFDTRMLADGRHMLTAIAPVRTDYLDEVRTAVSFVTKNFWKLKDPLDAPLQAGGWFGTIDLSRTVDASAGWGYATGDEDVFFGDNSRRVRIDNTTEYLGWETPLWEEVSLTLYAQESEIDGVIELEISADGVHWQPIAYTKAETGRSSQGWLKVVLSGDASGYPETEFFRLTLRESLEPIEIQLGEAYFVGVNRK